MTRAEQRQVRRKTVLAKWSRERGVELSQLDDGQQWVAYAGLQILSVFGSLSPLRRVVEYALAHSGMDLGSSTISALSGKTDRAIRDTQRMEPSALLQYVQKPVAGHRPAKLKAEHAGPLAKYLVANKGAKVAQIQQFIERELGQSVDRLTLRRYMKQYGLGCLRQDDTVEEPPFLSARRSTEARSC
jgi:hypothetical protein